MLGANMVKDYPNLARTTLLEPKEETAPAAEIEAAEEEMAEEIPAQANVGTNDQGMTAGS
jgi:hypothetical protein